MDSRKQAVSIRMNAADLRNVKRLAKRLGVRDSDIIRVAVKLLLGKLSPLCDQHVRGRSLVPVFVESSSDLFRYFDLDAMRLESIINEGADENTRVDHEDITLIAMSGIQQSYAKLKLTSIGGGKHVAWRADAPEDKEELNTSLRRYLYQKYVYGERSGVHSLNQMETQT
ncbi:MAG TPA: hypothetical protein VJU59_43650 [Paraburkholderia sp.]|uniref:hypothetical protein n=1 Tax=Paraburkholderia sp. TaxID=1926495 RepID=UPI002B46B488|nr:hypothetical protein [Paraburkholderia sp.]HKR46489.1 hypothetical protein [Paraburkholderia sp.]